MRTSDVARKTALALLIFALPAPRPATADGPGTPDAADIELVRNLGEPAKADAASKALVARGAAAVAALVAGLPDAKLREPALEVIARIGPAAKEAVPAVATILKISYSPARPAAARALGAIGADAAQALPLLTAWISEGKATNRADALTAAGRILVAQAPPPARKGPPPSVAAAIDAGCGWIERHQEDDGRVSCGSFSKRCAGASPCADPGGAEHDVGVTGLATLALLGARGDAPQDPHRAAAVRAATWIAGRQDRNGVMGDRRSAHVVYDHFCGALALAETLRATSDDSFRRPLELAVAAALTGQSPKCGGWRYGIPTDDDGDTSVTVWAADLIAAARAVGVGADRKAVDGALAWVESMTLPEYGRCGYMQRGGAPARLNDVIKKFPPELVEPMTACGIRVRIVAGRGRRDDPSIEKGLGLLAARLPRWSPPSVDFYYWYHGSVVAHDVGGEFYGAWRAALVAALLPSQRGGATICARGSWDPVDPWGTEGGRAYSTALAVLALEACGADPADRPALTAAQARTAAAIEKAAQTDDVSTRTAALRALDAVHDAYR